ncbi:MAG TPA: hypothetical protein DCZ13_12195 [Porticoccaceae bacterium]|nr:hypothetical protein [Porticoccaceae bacterium]
MAFRICIENLLAKSNKLRFKSCCSIYRPNTRNGFTGHQRFSFTFVLSVLFLLHISSVGVLAESVQSPAIPSPLASKVLLTDSAQIGKSTRYIGVGLYGNIVYSDNGETWQQANSPTQVLITNVFFVDDKHGWAGGHDTLILHTSDGGENWEIQYEDPITGGDIPKPIIDIYFADKNRGFAIGAYGLILETFDGGKNWSQLDTTTLYDRLESMEMEPEPTFNGVIPYAGKLLIVAELGTILLFDPNGTTDEERWQILESPYEGTYFGVTQTTGGALYIYGLRGNIYRSTDGMGTWEKIKTDVIANIFDAIELSDGRIVFLGASGTVLTLSKNDDRAERYPYPGFEALVSGQIIEGSELFIFGARGVQRLQVKR